MTRRNPPPKPDPLDGRVEIRASAAEVERWRRRARDDGRSLSNWIRVKLNRETDLVPYGLRDKP